MRKKCFTIGKLHINMYTFPGGWIYKVHIQRGYGITGMPETVRVNGHFAVYIHRAAVRLSIGHDFFCPNNTCSCGALNPDPVDWSYL